MISTKVGKYLEEVFSRADVEKIIEKHGAFGYAVVMKMEEILNTKGKVPDTLRLYQRIAVDIGAPKDFEKVTQVIDYMKELYYLVKDENGDLLHEETYKNYQKAVEISAIRKESGNKGGRPKETIPVFTEKFYEIYFAYIDYLNEATGRSYKKAKGQAIKAKKQFNARLKQGYTLDDFKKAIDNAAVSEWHSKKTNFNHLKPELLTREDKLIYWMNVIQETPKEQTVKQVMHRLNRLSED